MIRISGPDAASIAADICRRPNGDPFDLRSFPSHRVALAHICDPVSGSLIDEVLLTWMAGPHTYTTEDTVEISCHGGQLPLQETLRVILGAGARHAEPGEFTLRAFVNGRLDLSQAESVLNVIEARTSEALRLAAEDLRGALAERLAPAREAVISLLAYLDAAADFPEDEIPGTDVDADLATAIEALHEIVAGSARGMLYREGAEVVLAGRPNVGKSSLLNALLKADRAIVTPIAGTTRDVIAESCNIHGIPVTLVDTAGIADTEDLVEQLGIERSQRAMSRAAVVVLVLDGTAEPSADDLAIAGLLLPSENRCASADGASSERAVGGGAQRGDQRDVAPPPMPVVIAINKCDLPVRKEQTLLTSALPEAAVVAISSKTGDGLPALEESVAAALTGGQRAQPSLISVRQRAALERALAHLQEALTTRTAGFPLDLLATDVRAALHAIGEVTGENVDEAVLTEIFSRFCIGK